MIVLRHGIIADSRRAERPMTGERLIFRDAAGRELTTSDLRGATGKVRWEVIGAGRVPEEAHRLHQQARTAGSVGDYALALTLLDRAQALAPSWPYPIYDAAYTHLIQGDPTGAFVRYEKVDELAPRGFFTSKTTLDMLCRERAGELFPGFSHAFITLEWMNDAAQKAVLLTNITQRYPDFSPAWKELALLLRDPDERLAALENGLVGRMDAQTRAMLLLNKAAMLSERGDRAAAIEILGGLALDPASTLSGEAMAKALLAQLFSATTD
jgi:tetratricopeptide (TPR) repeat protein